MAFISAKIEGDEGWGGQGDDVATLAPRLQSISIDSRPVNPSTRPGSKFGSLPALNVVEKEIVTVGKKGRDAESCGQSQEMKNSSAPLWSWDDQLLKTLERPAGKKKKGKTIVWRPGSGRHVDEGSNSYRPFNRIVRVLHLDDALEVCLTRRMKTKPVITFSSIDSRDLPSDHPCARMKVLWFSANSTGVEEESSNWYGNVEFAVDAEILLRRWKYFFLVEMMTAPTHTTSRILVTNKDYSSVLPKYSQNRAGGPWRVTAEGQKALINCSRYQFKGTNFHNHVLEFMIEATPQDEKEMLKACQISFKNHERARNTHIPHVCNRSQRMGTMCPTPFSASQSARSFFESLQLRSFPWNQLLPKLSPEAEKQLQWFLEDERKRAMQYNRVIPHQGSFSYVPVYYAQL